MPLPPYGRCSGTGSWTRRAVLLPPTVHLRGVHRHRAQGQPGRGAAALPPSIARHGTSNLVVLAGEPLLRRPYGLHIPTHRLEAHVSLPLRVEGQVDLLAAPDPAISPPEGDGVYGAALVA